ncbi:ExeA family protein [Microbacterium sp. HSID17254]|uniref:ExeA family protein n=1 Tax=Microbacterium sp. HSID17254 TaxID=2419509 RepID=UPI001931150A|nr:AAA family ATPase [Microbacterium sp. HSID17254]
MIEKLQAHYGFDRMPFGRDLAPGKLHRHASHNEAVARIGWCIAERSIGVVTGEVGAGKTVAVRTVLQSLDPSRYTVIYLPNPLIGVRGIHEEIVNAFGQPAAHLGSRLMTQTGKVLAAEREERGRTPVLVIDEAHLLTYEQLEAIRMLTNQSMDQDSPLASLLVGQPTLRRTMKLAVLAALEQRTALRYTMPGMTPPETSSYITHHLKLVGRPDQLFVNGLLELTPGGTLKTNPGTAAVWHDEPRHGAVSTAGSPWRWRREPRSWWTLMRRQWLSRHGGPGGGSQVDRCCCIARALAMFRWCGWPVGGCSGSTTGTCTGSRPSSPPAWSMTGSGPVGATPQNPRAAAPR